MNHGEFWWVDCSDRSRSTLSLQHSFTPFSILHPPFSTDPPSSIFNRLSLKLPRVFVIAIVVPLRDFPTGRAPDAVMRTNVLQRFFQILDPKRHADDERMERQAEHTAPPPPI